MYAYLLQSLEDGYTYFDILNTKFATIFNNFMQTTIIFNKINKFNYKPSGYRK